MAPGISSKSKLHSLLKENLVGRMTFNEQTMDLQFKLFFKGYDEPVLDTSIYLDHMHDLRRHGGEVG